MSQLHFQIHFSVGRRAVNSNKDLFGTDHSELCMIVSLEKCLKSVTDGQVFYDKFLCDKFYLPSARAYVRQILYDKFLVF